MASEPGAAFRLRGRAAQTGAVRDRLDAVQAGRGGTVLVTGPPGLGKTVLLDAAEAMARGRGIRVFRGTGDVAARVIPFAPLLQALVSAPGSPVDPAALRDLSHSADQRFWLLRELQESLERAALRTPVLVAVDDVQWADDATLAALTTLPRQLGTHPILWLLAARPGELTEAARQATARMTQAGALRVTLPALDKDAVAAVTEDLLGGAPDAALLELAAGVGGHPFLLAELIRGLREEGTVAVGGGTARLAGTRVPLRFTDAVGDQLTSLSARARDALQTACLLGSRFSADQLAAVTDARPAAVFDALREALAAGLIVEDGDQVAFRNDLVREAVEASQPRTVRDSRRRRAADVLPGHGAPPAGVAELALDVARPGAAVRLWLPDAWQALTCIAVARLDEAFTLIDAGMQAARREGPPANIRVWSMLRFRALFSSGRLADARAEADAAIQMADETGEGSHGYITQVARYILGRVALHTGDTAGIAQARRAADRAGQGRETPSSRRLASWLTLLLTDAELRGAPAAAQALDPLAEYPLPVTSPQTYADTAALARILRDAGRHAEAETAVARLEGFAALHPDFPFLNCAALHARAVLDGDHDAALRAVAASDRDPRPLVRAAVLEDAGRLLPGPGKTESVRLLNKALGCYAAAGAERDAARVRSLLRARGVRPSVSRPRSAPGWPELTESELSVVSLVVQGATNREVAGQLYLSAYTVNSHLRHVYGKLGIRSRVDLTRLAARRGMPDRPPAAGQPGVPVSAGTA